MKNVLLLLSVILLSHFTIWAYDFEVDGIYYNITKSEAVVTYKNASYNSYSGTIIIPKTVIYNKVKYSVTAIGDSAFADCTALTSVELPNSVTTIGDWAFYWCKALTHVTIGNNVTTIGERAFYWCPELTKVTIPASVTNIGAHAFSLCPSLTKIDVANANKYYCTKDGVLYSKDMTELIQCPGGFVGALVIPQSVITIDDEALIDCMEMTSVTIPVSVQTIGDEAFSGCIGLTSVTIPASITSIGEYAFADCTGLTELTILCSVTNIAKSAVFGCPGVKLPDTNNQ